MVAATSHASGYAQRKPIGVAGGVSGLVGNDSPTAGSL